MQQEDHEGFIGERSFDYLLYERPEESCIYRLLPEANKLLHKQPPPTDAARVIKGFGRSKLPAKLEDSNDIAPPLVLEEPQSQMTSSLVVQPVSRPISRLARVSELEITHQAPAYHRYELEQTMEERYSGLTPVYSRYPHCKKGPYKHFTYSGKYVSIYQLLDLQSQDCHELTELDYTNRSVYNQLHNSPAIFDSAFECGNLLKAFEVGRQLTGGEREFDLIIENDTNTNGYNQWFMFMMANIPKGTKVKLNLVNMENPNSFFGSGMKPAVLSLKRFRSTMKTWHRDGSDIQYILNNLLRSRNNLSKYWQLSFTYQVDFFEDVVYFAAAFPYSYSKLVRTISTWEDRLKIRREVLTVTPSQNYCFMMNISRKEARQKAVLRASREQKKGGQKEKQRPVVIVTARQHPGETMPNFVLEGFMEYLCENQEQVLDSFEFVVVPMINIDGCIYGNFRSNLTGVDLNRRWTDPDKLFTPEVQSLKTFIEQLSQTKKIAHFIDLHGHSRDLGTFIYSSSKGKRGKLLPYLLGEHCESFDRGKCTFGIAPSKQDTARANVFQLMRSRCQSITIESSFYGYEAKSSVVEYYPQSLKKVGRDLLKCLMLVQSKSHLPIAHQLAYWTNSTNSSILQGKFGNGDDEGSDEDPTGDYIEEIQKKVVKIRQTYKLDPSPAKQSPQKTVTAKPSILASSKKPTAPIMVTASKSLRRRITSSYARVPSAYQVNPTASSTILKPTLLSTKLISTEIPREFLVRKDSSRPKLRLAENSVSQVSGRLSRLMVGLINVSSNQRPFKRT